MARRSSFIAGISRLVEESGRRQRQAQRAELRAARGSVRLARSAIRQQDLAAKAFAREEAARSATEAQNVEDFIETPLASSGRVVREPKLSPTALYQVPFERDSLPDAEELVAQRLRDRGSNGYLDSLSVLLAISALGLGLMTGISGKEASATFLSYAGATGAVVLALGVSLYWRNREWGKAQAAAKAWGEAEQQRLEAEQLQAEQTHKASEERRIRQVKRLWEGDPASIEAALTTSLDAFTFPIEVAAHVQMLDSERFVVEIDLPEIEDLPAEMCRLLKSGRLSLKEKPRKVLAAQYANLVCGLAFLYAAEVMRAVPTARQVIVNGYTDRIDPRTGHEVENYVIAGRFDRAGLAALNLDTIDPITAIEQFDHRLGRSRSGELSTIEPMSAASA